MRKKLIPLSALLLALVLFAYPAGVPAASPHPEIHAAIDSLRHAREHLDHAAHDFGGHRVEAIGAIDRAIEQLDICLRYDR
jgi:hypothetical protein